MILKLTHKGYSQTISAPITIKGYAPFSAKASTLKLIPSLSGRILFKYHNKIFPVSPENIKLQSETHTTIIKAGQVEIIAVEHLLAALFGLNIDSLLIELEGDNQIPALDSSADYFTKILIKTGFKKISKKRPVIQICQKFKFSDRESDSFAQFSPCKHLKIDAEINFKNFIGIQRYNFNVTSKSFIEEISWGRTFIRSPLNGDVEKWQRLRKLLPFLPENPEKSPVLVFSDHGFITKLIKEDEPIRHKILDFLGDLSLLGMKLEGEIKLYKPGHYFNHRLVRFLASKINK